MFKKITRYYHRHWKGFTFIFIGGGIIIGIVLISYFTNIGFGTIFGIITTMIVVLLQKDFIFELFKPHPKIKIIGNPIYGDKFIEKNEGVTIPGKKDRSFLFLKLENKKEFIEGKNLKMDWIIHSNGEFGKVVENGTQNFDIVQGGTINISLTLNRSYIKCPLEKEMWFEATIKSGNKLIGFISKQIIFLNKKSDFANSCPLQ